MDGGIIDECMEEGWMDDGWMYDGGKDECMVE